MNRNQIIAIVIGAILIFAGCAYFSDKDKLSVTIGGEEESFLSEVFRTLIPADVGGILAEGGEEIDYWTYEMSPGSSGTINVAAFNTFSTHTWYKVSVKENGNTIYISSQEFIAPDGYHDWFFTYNAPSRPGDYLIKIDSFKKNPFSDTLYQFDDSDEFTIRVKEDEPTDPCEGVSCPSKCVGETYYYSGYCVDGICEYSSAKVDGKCGYTDPVSDPCEGTTCPDVCVEPYTFKSNGVCVNGECEYIEEANSEECGYIAPTATETPTETATGTGTPTSTPTTTVTPPTNGEPEDEGIPTLYYIVGILAISGAVALYLIGSKR